MSSTDLVLIHPPSTFRNASGLAMHGMVTASVPSTPAVEIYPLGFLSIGAYLERHGYSVAIRNLALAASLAPWIRPARFMPFLRGRVAGIDLQWASNADGALETADAIKRHSPATPVVMGGLSASCFWKELLACSQVDYVIRGDSAEYPFLKLMDALRGRGALEEVPNLAWRDSRGEIRTNGITYVPESLDDFPLDYGWVFRSCSRRLDPFGILWSLPYRDWLANPSAAVITQKGCPHGCIFCGGSIAAYAKLCNRRKQAVKSPPAVMRDVMSAAKILSARIFLAGDLRDPAEDYASEVFDLYEASGIRNPLIIETMAPAPREYFEKALNAAENVVFQMSVDTHDDQLRQGFGRKYTRREIEETIRGALDAGCRSVRIFFGIGLPGQDRKSVMDTVSYCGQLLEEFGADRRFYPFISPLLPFIEPGSRAFANPSKYGYDNRARTLADFISLMRKPSWAETLGYSTEHMDRKTFVETSYEAIISLNRLHEKHGLLSARVRLREEHRLKWEFEEIMTGRFRKKLWLQGESSLYTPSLRGNLRKLFFLRSRGILSEILRGLIGKSDGH